MDPTVLNNLTIMERGEPEVILKCVLGHKPPIVLARLLEWSGLHVQEFQTAIHRLLESGEAILWGRENDFFQDSYLVSLTGWEHLLQQMLDFLSIYHSQYPLRPTMPREELHSRLELPDGLFRFALQHAVDLGQVTDGGTGISLAGFAVQLTPQQQKLVDTLLKSHRAAGSTPPIGSESIKIIGSDVELFQFLVVRGDLIGVGDDIYYLADIYHEMVTRLVAYLQEHGKITVAQTRDLFGASRRYTITFLNHLDQKITRRVGDERYLR